LRIPPNCPGNSRYIARNLSTAIKPNATCYSNGISGYLRTALNRDASCNRDDISGSLAAHANRAQDANQIAGLLARLYNYVAAYLNATAWLFSGNAG
jgi:hypothetical protein